MEDEHPNLRSKAAGQLIERLPGDPAEPAGDHGTKVAGVVAMTVDENANVKHKGIAYGLDTILDATYTQNLLIDGKEAMEWAMTYPSEAAADVVNYSLGAVRKDRGEDDYTMDMGAPDYAFGWALDRLIDAHDVLIIKLAGNRSTSSKKKGSC